MKKLLLILLLVSCKPELPKPEVNSLDWCGVTIQAIGDSFIEAPGAIPIAWYLADYLNIDTLLPASTGWYMKHGDSAVSNRGYSGRTTGFIVGEYLEGGNKNRAQLLMAGRNNAKDTAEIIKHIAQFVAATPHSNIIIIGILHGDFDYDWKDSGWLYPYIEGLNTRLAGIYKQRFINPNEILAPYAIASDSVSVRRGVTPSHLTIDGLHLNWLGCKYLGEGIGKQLKKCK